MSKQDTTITGEAGSAVNSGDKTFSQDDVNRIVSERLGREKAKLEGSIVEREQQLAHREFMLEAKETMQAKGLPLALLDALNSTNREAFEKSLTLLEENHQAISPTPPPPMYATGTGSMQMLGGERDVIREGFGLNRKD